MSSSIDSQFPRIPCTVDEDCYNYLIASNGISKENAKLRVKCFGDDIGCDCRGDYYWTGTQCQLSSSISRNNAFMNTFALFFVTFVLILRLFPMIKARCKEVKTKIISSDAHNDSQHHHKSEGNKSNSKSNSSNQHQHLKRKLILFDGTCFSVDNRDFVLFLVSVSAYLFTPLSLISSIIVNILGPVSGEFISTFDDITTITTSLQLVISYISLLLLAISFVEIIQSMNRIKSNSKARYAVLVFSVCFLPVHIYLLSRGEKLYASLTSIVFVLSFVMLTTIGPGWMYEQLSRSISREKRQVAAALSSVSSSSLQNGLKGKDQQYNIGEFDNFGRFASMISCCHTLWFDVMLDMCICPCNRRSRKELNGEIFPKRQFEESGLDAAAGEYKSKQLVRDSLSMSMKEIKELSPIPTIPSELKSDIIAKAQSLRSLHQQGSQSQIDTSGSNVQISSTNRTESHETSIPRSPHTRTESSTIFTKSPSKTRLESGNQQVILEDMLATRERASSRGDDEDVDRVAAAKNRISRRLKRSDSKDSTSSVGGLRQKRNTETHWKGKERLKREREFRQNQFFARFLRRVLQLCVRVTIGLLIFAVFAICLAATSNPNKFEILVISNQVTLSEFCRVGQILAIFFTMDSIMWYFSDIINSKRRNNHQKKKSTKEIRPLPGMLMSIDSFRGGSEFELASKASKQTISKSEQSPYPQSSPNLLKVESNQRMNSSPVQRVSNALAPSPFILSVSTASPAIGNEISNEDDGLRIEKQNSRNNHALDAIIVDAFVNDD